MTNEFAEQYDRLSEVMAGHEEDWLRSDDRLRILVKQLIEEQKKTNELLRELIDKK
jgi:hypothetical protein